ncbi:MAG: hypothetical protein SOZ71_08835 [Clostridium sp.]|nr:hypothetical protein [Clostridium sp.]
MTFCEQLNEYIKQIDCSSQELVSASGLTTSVISRYRRGDRSPNIRSKQLEQLVDGLYKLFKDKKLNITREEIYNNLSNTLYDISIDFEELRKNFNELVTTLNINIDIRPPVIEFIVVLIPLCYLNSNMVLLIPLILLLILFVFI